MFFIVAKHFRTFAFATILLSIQAVFADSPTIHFEKDVLPSLVVSCFKCHSQRLARPKGDLQFDSRAGFISAIGDASLFEVGQGKTSRLVELISLPKADDEAMPPAGK